MYCISNSVKLFNIKGNVTSKAFESYHTHGSDLRSLFVFIYKFRYKQTASFLWKRSGRNVRNNQIRVGASEKGLCFCQFLESKRLILMSKFSGDIFKKKKKTVVCMLYRIVLTSWVDIWKHAWRRTWAVAGKTTAGRVTVLLPVWRRLCVFLNMAIHSTSNFSTALSSAYRGSVKVQWF